MTKLHRLRLPALALAGCAALAGPAAAGTFSAAEIGYDNALLSSFNLVTLGNLASSGSVSTEGRVIVGGNLSIGALQTYAACNGTTCAGNATTAADATGQNYGALTVFGNLSTGLFGNLRAGYNVTAANRTANGNTAYLGGSVSGTFQANGTATTGTNLNIDGSGSGLIVNNGRTTTTTSGFAGYKTGSQTNASYPVASAAAVFPFSSSAGLASEVIKLSQGIANLPGTPQVLPPMTTGLFTATTSYASGGKTYGVVTTTLANLAGQTSFGGINNGSNAATFVIVTGDGANYTLPNLGSYADDNKVIFDFVDATTLKFAGAWNGSILAPLANVTQMGGSINGTVIVNSIVQSQAILSANLFAGDLSGLIPEPASLALFGLGAAAAAAVRRRRAAT